MSSILIAVCIATTLVSQICFAAEIVCKQSLQAALERSGGNRIELKTALRKVKGKDAEYLISHASQCDLVNLNAEMIIENVIYARKVHGALPYLGENLDDEMWGEWVLPHRVLEEDLCLWRKEFYEMMQPVIAGKEKTAEVAEAIRFWLWSRGEPGGKRVTFQDAENRLRTPVEILKGGVASCGELALLHVSFLRAVGIPARHCSTGWWQGKEGWHFYTEYWDGQLQRWVAIDDLVARPAEKVARGEWNTLATHAVPGFHGFENAYYIGDFSTLLETTGNVGAVASFRFRVAGRWGHEDDRTPEGHGHAAVSVWNGLGWRKVAVAEAEGKDGGFVVSLGQPKQNEAPTLMTVVRDGRLFWGLKRAGTVADGGVLEVAKAGICLRWPE